MAQYKLVYFDLNGRGEPLRWVLKLARQKFEEERIPRQDFAQHQSRFPLGTLPVLYENGVELTQTNAIGQYLCDKFGFVAKDKFLQYRSAEATEVMADCAAGFKAFMGAQDAEAKEAARLDFINRIAPMLLKRVTTILEETQKTTTGPYVAGDRLTWADLVIGNHLQVFSAAFGVPLTSFFDQFPLVRDLYEAVVNQPEIKAHLESRPKTRF